MVDNQCDQIWPNFATIVKVFGYFLRVYFDFLKTFNLLVQFLIGTIGQIFIVDNGQILDEKSSHIVTLSTIELIINFLKLDSEPNIGSWFDSDA